MISFMPPFPLFCEVFQKVRHGFAFPYPLWREGGCFFFSCQQVVVYLPFGVHQASSALPEEVGGMEGGHHRYAVIVDPVAPGADDAGFMAQKEAEGHFAKAYDDFGLHQSDFRGQPDGAAEPPFFHGGGPVSPGTAFDDVCHIHMVPGNAYGKEGFVQKLSGGAHQGSSVIIFHPAGALPYDHERRVGRSCGKHGAQASLFPERAAAAASDGLCQGFMGRIGYFFRLFIKFPMAACRIFFGVFMSK